jgi:hypothetical protein
LSRLGVAAIVSVRNTRLSFKGDVSMHARAVVRLMAIIAAVASQACEGAPDSPSEVVTRLDVRGGASLSAVGETSQLTATATFHDGRIADVTSKASWESSDPSVLTVSPDGLVTVVGFGTSIIEARYTQSSSIRVFATPPGTFVALGRVREPGQSGVNDVRVSDPLSGTSTLTSQVSGERGSFSLGALTNTRLRFEKQAYEGRDYDVTPNARVEVALQRMIRLTAGETVAPLPLTPHDLSYDVGSDRCEPCRLVRIVTTTAGVLQLKLTWTEPTVALSVWANGRLFSGTFPDVIAEVPVSAGEVVTYVGAVPPQTLTIYVPFSVATSIQR